MLEDLGLSTNEYNTGQTIFYLCFLFAELPSQLISKKLGPDNWIPIQMFSWSLVASCQAFLAGRSSFWACRALLGLIGGGFIPDVILYLSYFYTGKELPIRLSFFWTAYQSTSIISAFLAYGILHMRGMNGLAGWRCKGDMHNRQGLDLPMFWACLKDYHMWPLFLLGASWMIPSIPITSYLTLQIKSQGFGTFETNLLTIPAYVLFIINLLAFTWISEKLNERFLLATISQWWALPLLIALEVLPANRSPWAAWALSILLYAMPYVHAVLVAVTSRNAGTVRTRTVASAIYNMLVQVSNIIGNNIYRTNDKPQYFTGNKILLALVAYNIVLFVATKVFYVRVNARRDKIWNALSREQKEHYLSTTKDRGNKRLDFRFAH
ncbi:putative transporter [Pseudocercospora fuligena]|uniref:Putative transporter n=1 Tax=Pseudocercospora fuligena TaxID=685502 RepID=A0A8H6RG15_9PEZI|nr:putative transporter [Pseudocercospora fuligena]